MAPETRHVLLVARGVGMATMAPLAESAQAAGARVTAILSARSPEFLMSNDYLKSVGAVTRAVYDADGSSDMPHVEAMITALHAEQPIDLLATCGSNRLLQLVKQLGARFGIPGQVALEQHMGCAIGMCFCCVRPFRTAEKVTYRRVCCEGPVFDVRETLSW
jgi:dihydroorotate dehydrogenase electron transfer subunit